MLKNIYIKKRNNFPSALTDSNLMKLVKQNRHKKQHTTVYNFHFQNMWHDLSVTKAVFTAITDITQPHT